MKFGMGSTTELTQKHESRFSIVLLLKRIIGERDTYMGNTIENWGCLFGRTYVILYFDPPHVCVRSAFDPVPNFNKQNPPAITRITLEIELCTALNYFACAVKTLKLMGVPFIFKLVAICHSYKPYSQHLLENSLSIRRTTKVSLA